MPDCQKLLLPLCVVLLSVLALQVPDGACPVLEKGSAEDYALWGRELMKNGHYHDAINFYNRAISLTSRPPLQITDRRYWTSYLDTRSSYLKLGWTRLASELTKQVRRKQPICAVYSPYYKVRSQAYYHAGIYKEALADLRKEGSLQELFLSLGEQDARILPTKTFQELSRHYELCCFDDDDSDGMDRRAILKDLLGDKEGALAEFKRCARECMLKGKLSLARECIRHIDRISVQLSNRPTGMSIESLTPKADIEGLLQVVSLVHNVQGPLRDTLLTEQLGMIPSKDRTDFVPRGASVIVGGCDSGIKRAEFHRDSGLRTRASAIIIEIDPHKVCLTPELTVPAMVHGVPRGPGKEQRDCFQSVPKPWGDLVLTYIHGGCRCLKSIKLYERDFGIAVGVEQNFVGMAQDLEKIGRYLAAEYAANEEIQHRPHESYGYILRGRARVGMARFEAALADYRRAIDLEPDCAYWWAERSGVFSLIGRYKEALADLNKATQIQRANSRWYEMRAQIYMVWKDFRRARADLDQVLKLLPENCTARLRRAELRIKCGDRRGAIDDYNRVVMLASTVVLAVKERDEALTELQKLKAVSSKSPNRPKT